MNPTKEQWEEIARQLDRMFVPIFLRCDSYIIQAGMVRSRKNTLKIAIYVDGFIRGKWTDGKDDEPKRFWRPITRSKYTAKYIKAMEKIYGKRKCKASGYYEKRTHYLPEWNRPMPLIRHLKKHNENIEVLGYEAYKAELDKIMEKDNG